MVPARPDPYPAGRADPARRAGAAARARTARPGLERRRWPTGSSPTLTTWRLTGPDGARALRQGRHRRAATPPCAAESERMVWAAAYLPVPAVVALEQSGHDDRPAHRGAPRSRRRPTRSGATTSPGWCGRSAAGCRDFHEAVGEEWCPFRFDLERALDHVRRRVATDDIDPGGLPRASTPTSTPAAALAELEATAPDDGGPRRVPRRLLPAQRAAAGRAG